MEPSNLTSISTDDQHSKKDSSFTSDKRKEDNRRFARESRERKKQYVADLQHSVASLQREKDGLVEEHQSLKRELDLLLQLEHTNHQRHDIMQTVPTSTGYLPLELRPGTSTNDILPLTGLTDTSMA
eukprot:CAMPEP_0172510516 /NCGR_PEP_ID=MMETSP1066-20121228/229058_1 /TAXON_ID=671091 /ORGANISM="Coscinodiscus wailesii, Strain CCMP2513" /LENGTH=126 /DNA_ID=CAMNT_0013289499 /DNA_START=14 /DNA_END=390 /DNA_ORIENTATION=+